MVTFSPCRRIIMSGVLIIVCEKYTLHVCVLHYSH